jgi:hypothetical protein
MILDKQLDITSIICFSEISEQASTVSDTCNFGCLWHLPLNISFFREIFTAS